MKENEIVLEGRNIKKAYKTGGRQVQSLDKINFFLRKKEILGIAGESGSGKSTLLKIISGIEKPDEGELFYKNKAYTGKGPKETGEFLQMVFQDAISSFDPRMTMRKALLEVPGSSEKDIIRFMDEFSLPEELLDRKAKTLSGGQCQRMSVIRALLSNARILLCDEITGALDVTTQAQVIGMIEKLRDTENISVIIVSHDIALLSRISDRIMVLKTGVCVEEGNTGDVIKNPAHPYTKELLSGTITVD